MLLELNQLVFCIISYLKTFLQFFPSDKTEYAAVEHSKCPPLFPSDDRVWP